MRKRAWRCGLGVHKQARAAAIPHPKGEGGRRRRLGGVSLVEGRLSILTGGCCRSITPPGSLRSPPSPFGGGMELAASPRVSFGCSWVWPCRESIPPPKGEGGRQRWPGEVSHAEFGLSFPGLRQDYDPRRCSKIGANESPSVQACCRDFRRALCENRNYADRRRVRRPIDV